MGALPPIEKNFETDKPLVDETASGVHDRAAFDAERQAQAEAREPADVPLTADQQAAQKQAARALTGQLFGVVAEQARRLAEFEAGAGAKPMQQGAPEAPAAAENGTPVADTVAGDPGVTGPRAISIPNQGPAGTRSLTDAEHGAIDAAILRETLAAADAGPVLPPLDDGGHGDVPAPAEPQPAMLPIATAMALMVYMQAVDHMLEALPAANVTTTSVVTAGHAIENARITLRAALGIA